MAKLIEFETERLHLRRWRSMDRVPFAALNSDPAVMEYFPAALDRAASDALATHAETAITENGWGFWAAQLKSSSEFVGCVGVGVPAADLPFSPCAEIAWRLAQEYWGKGLATEAARGALRIGFESLALPEIVSFTTVRNHRSRAVMEKIGMREADETFEHPGVPEGSALREHCLYRLTREQWISCDA